MVAVTAQPAPPTEMAPDYKKSRTLFLSLLFLATVAPLVLMPLLARVSPASTSIQSVTNLMIFLGANGHVATTLFFYTDGPLKSYMREHRGRYLVAPLALVLVTGLLYHSLGVAYTSYILLYYFSWQTYHYMRQNYGILAFVSAATDTVRLHWLEKVILNLGVIAGILGMVRLMGLQEGTVLEGSEVLLYYTGFAVYLVLPLFVIGVLVANPGIIRSPARLGGLLLCALFYLPTFLFRDMPSAILSYALAHGFQYFVFMYFVSGNRRQGRALGRVVTVALLALIGGGVLMLMSDELIWGGGGRFVFGCYLGLVMSHFVVDAGVWRLSGSFQRQYLSEPFDFILARPR